MNASSVLGASRVKTSSEHFTVSCCCHKHVHCGKIMVYWSTLISFSPLHNWLLESVVKSLCLKSIYLVRSQVLEENGLSIRRIDWKKLQPNLILPNIELYLLLKRFLKVLAVNCQKNLEVKSCYIFLHLVLIFIISMFNCDNVHYELFNVF